MSTLRRVGFPLAERRTANVYGQGKRNDFLRLLAVRDWGGALNPICDFLVKALDTTNFWSVAAGAGATTWAVLADVGGMIRGVTGVTAATSGLQLQYGAQKYYKGANGALLQALIRTSLIVELRIEIGFVDAMPAVNTNLVNSLVTPTFNTVAAGAVFVYDNASAVTTIGLYGIGSAVAANKQTVTGPAPVISTLYSVAVQIIGAKAFLYLNDGDIPVASVDIAATDGLIPVVSVKGSDTNSKNFDVDLFLPLSGRLL